MTKKTVGFYGGKFAPIPHMGHVFAMIQASTYVDELHVCIMYDEEYEKRELYSNSKVEYISYKQRLRWWKQIAKGMSHVKIHAIYEEQTGDFKDWELGAESIKAVINKQIDYVFSSEVSYDSIFSKIYPNSKHIIIDYKRENYNISGTKLREEGVFKHWEYIPRVAKPYFNKKVVVVGTESSGKSTIVKNLSNVYNTNYVEEFGRTFYERLGSYETLETDFPEIAYEQQYKIKKALELSNKILFIDTETNVTQNFSIAYEGKRMAVLDEISKLQNYDLWLFLEPDVKWVDDGTRIFGDVRNEMTLQLKELLKERGIDYKVIKGDYNSRLNNSIRYINQLMD